MNLNAVLWEPHLGSITASRNPTVLNSTNLPFRIAKQIFPENSHNNRRELNQLPEFTLQQDLLWFFEHPFPSVDNPALLWLPKEAEWLFVEIENKQEKKAYN